MTDAEVSEPARCSLVSDEHEEGFGIAVIILKV
jgi:hypothetical protein